MSNEARAPRDRDAADAGDRDGRADRSRPRARADATPAPAVPASVPADDRRTVLQGTLDLMILQTLATLGPQHGYAIAARLEQVSGGALQLNMGTLYPGIVRLEARGWIAGSWAQTETNRRARFYDLTAKGRRQLEAERAQWLRMADIMARVLE